MRLMIKLKEHSRKLPKKKAKTEAGEEHFWELTIDGKVIDDGCDGQN